ncbi:MAG TPA: hypothetical protein VMM13_13170 [Euzebya sp.]|nr:hypothetical protein [Euzebya sp.]
MGTSHARCRAVGLLLGMGLLLTACAATPDAGDAQAPATAEEDSAVTGGNDDATQWFPDVIQAQLAASGDAWRLTATLSSPYDSPERYADAFRAATEDGTQLGVRELLHDHAGEQPFTRSLEDLQIPEDIDRIVVQGRDLEHGWGGQTVTVEVPR